MSYVDQELTVEDMLADPIVQILMRYDGISASDVRHTIDQVNQNRPESPELAEPENAHQNRAHWAAKPPAGRHTRHQAA